MKPKISQQSDGLWKIVAQKIKIFVKFWSKIKIRSCVTALFYFCTSSMSKKECCTGLYVGVPKVDIEKRKEKILVFEKMYLTFEMIGSFLTCSQLLNHEKP